MKSKLHILLLTVFISINTYTYSQPSPWQWSRGATGGQFSEGNDVATDAAGNVYATGFYFGANISFGNITLVNHSNYEDGIFVKYDASGNVMWAKDIGGSLDDGILSVCTDPSGYVYISGFFNSPTLTIGSFTITNSYFASYPSLFMAKFDTNGNVVWLKGLTSATGDSFVFSITTDLSGNVFIAGEFENTITFGTTTLTGTGGYDAYVAKLDSAGTLLWANSLGGLGDEANNNISADNQGNLFVAGNFSSDSVTIGTTTIINKVTGSFNSLEGYLYKLNSSGVIEWVNTMQGNGSDYAYSTSADTSGNVVVTGCFSSDTLSIGASSFHVNGQSDLFIAKYAGNGNLLWAKTTGGPNGDYGYGITTYGTNIYLAGGFNSDTLVFGADSILFPQGGLDAMFLTQFDASGNVICTSTLTSGGDDAIGIAADPSGNIIIACDYYSIGAFQVGNDTLITAATEKLFVAKYNCTGTSVGLPPHNYTPLDVSISPNPFSYQTAITFGEEQKNTSIKIMNTLGQCVKELAPLKGSKEVIIDKGEMKPGIYFVQITDEMKNVVNRKIVVQ